MSAPDEADDAKLIRRAQRGDRDAFVMLYDRYDRRLWGFVQTLARHRATAEDICQETWLRAFRSLPQYDHRMPFTAWIFRIAQNLFCDQVRRRRTQKELANGDELLAEISKEILEDLSDETQRTQDCLAQLRVHKAEYGEVIARVLGNQRIAEIADALGQTAATISVWKSRGTDWMEKCVQRKERR